MKNNRGFRALAIVALIVAVAGISVAFAALSQQLSISAGGRIEGSKWDIKWSAATGVKSGSDAANIGTITGVGATVLSISNINLKLPGDTVTYTITAQNAGGIDAKLESISNLITKTVTFDPLEESSVTDVLTADDVEVSLTKQGGAAVELTDELLTGATQVYTLTVKFKDDVSVVPTKDVSIVIAAAFPWVQK